jgi:hypothetical protein
MAKRIELDADSVAEIGLMFLDGDCLEEILLDKYGHTDYDFDNFNACKKWVMRIERLNPKLGLTAVLWQLRPDNNDFAVPVVAGKAMPLSGFRGTFTETELRAALNGTPAIRENGESYCHFYPVKNSDAEIVGALELIEGKRPHVDI